MERSPTLVGGWSWRAAARVFMLLAGRQQQNWGLKRTVSANSIVGYSRHDADLAHRHHQYRKPLVFVAAPCASSLRPC